MLFNGRLGRQKGIDLMKASLEDGLSNEVLNLIVIGEGDSKYETYFKELERKFPYHMHYFEGFDQTFSEKAYAASDFFLLPSLFEPSGLNHLIAMRYGSLPIVRETGGLKDTVFHQGPKHNGFTFINYDEQEFQDVFLEAITHYYEKNAAFYEKITHAMQVTSYLEDMAEHYIVLYQKVLKDE
jgi:starch synthase